MCLFHKILLVRNIEMKIRMFSHEEKILKACFIFKKNKIFNVNFVFILI